ncbi:MAG: PIN domain-containing protein [Thermoproteota archaeon]
MVDTRLLIEYFYSGDPGRREKVSTKIRELLKESRGIIPTIVLAEIFQTTCEKRGREEAELRYISILRSGLKIEELTPDIAKIAGFLKCKCKNVPMGDCIIASIAIKNGARIISDDPHFDEIEEVKRIWV